MKIVATIEARMTSTRLPGKVLLPVLERPMLSFLLERLRRVPSLNEIVLATTVNSSDQPLVEFAKKNGLSFFRGSEEDVMSRVIGAAESVDADIVVEITGDCPLIDPAVIETTIQEFLSSKVDYAYNGIVRSYPLGMETQVFRLSTLKRSFSMTDHPLDREHVTRHIRQHPELFTHLNVTSKPEEFWPDLGLTLDEPKDYELIRRIIEYFYKSNPNFTCADMVQLLRNEKNDWVALNKEVQRKGLNS
jgi:spore coat polysaccharide biosynthesis protein SpsF